MLDQRVDRAGVPAPDASATPLPLPAPVRSEREALEWVRWMLVTGIWGVLALYLAVTAPDYLLAQPPAAVALFLALSAIAVVGIVTGRRRRGGLVAAVLALGLAGALLWIPGVRPVANAGQWAVVMACLLPMVLRPLIALPLTLLAAMMPPLQAWLLHPATDAPHAFDPWVWALHAVTTGGIVAWGWAVAGREAAEADAAEERAAAEREAALYRMAREDEWKRAAIRVHQSLLNTIRSVLLAPSFDRGELRQQLVADRAMMAALPDVPPASTDELAARLRPAAEANGLRLHCEGDALELPAAVGAPLELLLTEALRNAAEHGGASEVRLVTRRGDGGDEVLLADDGIGVAAESPAGMGTTLGAEPLIDAGSSVSIESGVNGGKGGTTVRVRLPAPLVERTDRARVSRWTPWGRARLVLVFALMANAAASVLYFPIAAALLRDDPRWVAVSALGLAGSAVTVAVAWSRRRLGAWLTLIPSLALLAVPVLVLAFGPSCEVDEMLRVTVGPVGFCLMTLAVMGRLWVGLPAVAVWLALCLQIVQRSPAPCATSVATALTVAVAYAAIALLMVLVAGVFFARDQRERMGRRALVREAEVRARAKTEVRREALRVTEQGVDELERVADAGTLSPEDRQRLLLLDARLRTFLQVVDEHRTGLMAFARDLVERQAQAGHPLQVRTLRGADDLRPLPPAVERYLTTTVEPGLRGGEVISVFTDGTEEYLSITMRDAAAPFVGAESLIGCAVEWGESSTWIDGAPGRTMVVRRRLPV